MNLNHASLTSDYCGSKHGQHFFIDSKKSQIIDVKSNTYLFSRAGTYYLRKRLSRETDQNEANTTSLPQEIKFSLRTKNYAQALIAANLFSELLIRFEKQLNSNNLEEISKVIFVTKKVIRTTLDATNVNQILAHMPLDDFDVEALSICKENKKLVTLETAASTTLLQEAEQQFCNFLRESNVSFDADSAAYRAAVIKLVRRKQFVGSLAQANIENDFKKHQELVMQASNFASFGITDPNFTLNQEVIVIPLLSEACETYLKETFNLDLQRFNNDASYRNDKKNDRAKKIYESIKELIFYLGDRKINEYKSKDFDCMFKSMLNAPKSRAKNHSNLSLEEIEATDFQKYKVTSNGIVSYSDITMSPTTVDKHRQKIKQFFSWVIRTLNENDDTYDLIRVNPVQTAAIKKDFKSQSWAAFSKDDLNKMFKSKLITNADESWQKWIPILSRATGARPNELAQLSVNDVRKDTVIIEDDDQPTTIYYLTIDDALASQSTKNQASRRHVPLHPMVVELGFIDYVDNIRATSPKDASLWPTLDPKNGYYTPMYSKWFSRKVLDNADMI